MARVDAGVENSRRAAAAQEILFKVSEKQDAGSVVAQELGQVWEDLNKKRVGGGRSVRTPLSFDDFVWGTNEIRRVRFSPEARLAVGAYYREELPNVKAQANKDDVTDVEVTYRRDRRWMWAGRGFATGLAVGAAAAVIAGGHALWLKGNDPEVVKLSTAQTKVGNAQEHLRWESTSARDKEKFAQPKQAVAELDQVLKIEIPIEVAQRLASVRGEIGSAFPSRTRLADSQPLADIRARLEEDRLLLEKLAESRREAIQTPLAGITLPGLVVAGVSVVGIGGVAFGRRKIQKDLADRRSDRSENTRFLEDVADMLNRPEKKKAS